MKVQINTITFCFDKDVSFVVENPDANWFFIIPPIGSTITVEGKTWKIAGINYDYNKGEVTVKSDVWEEYIRERANRVSVTK